MGRSKSTTVIGRGRHLLVGLAVATGCTDGNDAVTLGETASELAVSSYVTNGCSTSVVVGLSKQIAEEIGCMAPGSLVKFEPGGNLTFTSNAVLPYMSQNAKTALLQVTAGSSIQVNSGFRTLAQQYLLYRWYQTGRCGITAAATPGRSNHQSGRALDVANYSARITAMGNKGWSHTVPGDPVHFDYLSSPDIRGKDVMAFQRLWNRNNPGDPIPEDGAYGPKTETRLKAAPATGFAQGANCNQAAQQRVAGADIISVNGPDKMAPGTHGAYAITVMNTGNVEIPAVAKLQTVDGQPSPLHDPSSWTSTTEIMTIGTAIPVGGTSIIDIEVEAPAVTEETAVFSQFILQNGTDTFGNINVAVTITPNGDEGNSNEGDDEHDDDDGAGTGSGEGPSGDDPFESSSTVGGCSAGGNASGLALLLPALGMLIRRRRR